MSVLKKIEELEASMVEIVGVLKDFQQRIIHLEDTVGVEHLEAEPTTRKSGRTPASSSPKLSKTQIKEIRKRIHSGESDKSIAADYDVTPGAIWHYRKVNKG